MNLIHLKYAVEIARVGSLNKAAENLGVGQPNLSRAIKELEATIGIEIFERSTKGMVTTAKGQEFLDHAGKALKQIDEIEKLYKNGAAKTQEFSISVPRTSYISNAFANFTKKLGQEPAELFYKETNALRAIRNIFEMDYHLGIIRYAAAHDYYFKQMLEEKGLNYETVTEFSYRIVMSKNHKLSKKEDIRFDDLPPYIEIAHGDPFVPSLPMAAVKKIELPENIDRRIFVFERASQFEIMEENPETFMWVSPVPQKVLDRYNLVQKQSRDNKKVYKDVLIYKKTYMLSDLDRAFIAELFDSREKFMGK